ncbi:hypothetical protein HMPREF1619_02849 [Klebsiella pneumoniae 909957]|nr:hypothetical protein HMPREF9538_05044 [Klebsiella sp. MS 92-3]ESB00893.1 hypothetical protein HMPREF1619_02849 [Klebsiella pneumoniae 909957]KXA27160.1 hypothetical protein HMPREF3197_01915 [Klebsiella pneumoniae]
MINVHYRRFRCPGLVLRCDRFFTPPSISVSGIILLIKKAIFSFGLVY